ATGATVCTYQGHAQQGQGYGNPNRIEAVDWSLDGQRILSSSSAWVQVWEPLTGKTLLTSRNKSGYSGPAAWSPDSMRIASSDGWPGVVRVWDASSGEITTLYDGHTSYIFTLAWSPDWEFIASGGRDRTTQVWEPG